MMDYPLTLTHFFERSRRLFARKTLATRVPGQPLFRYTYADFAERTLRAWPARCATSACARATGWPPSPGTATATWSSTGRSRSAAPSCTRSTSGCRPQDLTYIINHAGDSVIFVDAERAGRCWPPSATSSRPSAAIVVMHDGAPSSGRDRRPGPRRPAGLRGAARAAARRWRPGPSSPRPTPRPCATPPAPPATPRASSTRTARSSCTAWPRR